VLYGLALILVLLFMPQGIMGLIVKVGNRFSKPGGEKTNATPGS